MQETHSTLESERSPGEGMTIHSIFAWKIPWTEEPSGPQSIQSQRVRYDWEIVYTSMLLSQFVPPSPSRPVSTNPFIIILKNAHFANICSVPFEDRSCVPASDDCWHSLACGHGTSLFAPKSHFLLESNIPLPLLIREISSTFHVDICDYIWGPPATQDTLPISRSLN